MSLSKSALKKKALKSKKRERISAAKILAQRNSRIEMHKQEKALRKDINATLEILQKHATYLDGSKKLSIVIYKFVNLIVQKKLNIPYLTDEIRDKFREYRDISKNITDKIVDWHFEMKKVLAETTLATNSENNKSEDLLDKLNKHYGILTGTLDMISIADNTAEISPILANLLAKILVLVKECNKIREETNSTHISYVVDKKVMEEITKVANGDIDKFIKDYIDYKVDFTPFVTKKPEDDNIVEENTSKEDSVNKPNESIDRTNNSTEESSTIQNNNTPETNKEQ